MSSTLAPMTSPPPPVDPAAVRRAREAAGLTRRQLARRAGVSPRTIDHVELGRHEPRPAILRAIAGALNVDVRLLQQGSDTP